MADDGDSPRYFMLECYGKLPGTRAHVTIETYLESSWMAGARITDDVPDPIECEVFSQGVMTTMFKVGGLIIAERLVDALLKAGVDNLEVFNAVIRDPKTGKTWTDYKVVNVVGIVSCADMKRTGTTAPEGELIDVPFDGLVIDEKRTGGALMFRLAEAVGGVVIHGRVRDALLADGFDDLSFEDPRQWIG